MDEPITVYPILYVLKLENDCYYIGMSHNLNNRLSQHIQGKGSKWTKINKFVSVEKVVFPANEKGIENRVTLEYIAKYGSDKVRGGSFTKV